MTIGMGAIGLGLLGRIECRAYEDMDEVDLVAGSDVDPDARAATEDEFGIPTYESHEELLAEHADELDAATIVTPHTLHYEQAVACLERDLHVFIEKPMTTDLAEAISLVGIADERDRILQVGYQRHFEPPYRELRRLIDSGRIGTVHMVSCYLSQDWIDHTKDSWRSNPALSGGGQLYDSGSHLLDTMLWVLDAEPDSVAAVMDERDHEVDVNSAVAATLERNGGTITASIGVSGDGIGSSPDEGLFIWGTDGRVYYDDETLTVVEGDGPEYTTQLPQRDFVTQTETKLERFVAAARGEEPCAVPGEYGVTVTALTEAAYRAHESGETVHVGTLLDEARAKASSMD